MREQHNNTDISSLIAYLISIAKGNYCLSLINQRQRQSSLDSVVINGFIKVKAMAVRSVGIAIKRFFSSGFIGVSNLFANELQFALQLNLITDDTSLLILSAQSTTGGSVIYRHEDG